MVALSGDAIAVLQSVMATGRPVRADSTTASTTCMVFRPSRPLQIGWAAPLMTSAKCVIWLLSGSLRSMVAVESVNGSHHDRSPE